MNPRLASIQESATIRVADQVREIERGGGEVLKLQTGDPDFATPAPIVRAATEALAAGHTHYAASRGLPEFRAALATKLARENGLNYQPDAEILVTHGASHGIFVALQAMLSPGDEVLIVSPAWPSYAAAVVLAGGVPVDVPTDPRAGFTLDPERIRRAVTSRSRLLILNSPANPSGRVFSREQMDAVAAIAVRFDLWVLADEVYEHLTYDASCHVSFASLPGMWERTVTVNSLSKTFAMTGWRVGYVAAPAPVVGQMLKVAQYAGTNVAPFSQRAGLAALTDPEVEACVQGMRLAYARRRRLVLDAIASVSGLRTVAPEGAFYFLVDVSRFSADSAAFAERLLREERVAVVPGVSFGGCAEGWVRMTFAVDDCVLTEGLGRLRRFIESGVVDGDAKSFNPSTEYAARAHGHPAGS